MGICMNRFFIDEVAGKTNNIIDKEDIKHISKVLRLDIDDEVEIVDREKKEYIMKIVDIKNDNICLEKVSSVDIQREDEIKVILYQGIPKGSKLEDICKNTTQAGIYQIIPVRFKRCVATDVNDKKIQRLQKIMDESAKQCKRNEIPEIKMPLSFDEMMKDLEENDANILFYEDERNNTIRDFVQRIREKKDMKRIGIIIGPEGGIDEKELEVMKKGDIDILSLGNRILRTEIASIIAKSILTYELENIR
ncbi:RNA methyltransferase, RsmE family [[Eubacterium] yurii subsp. margaretiae ATCC 43715]|nr:RNA methyltransferase, RsmE family [[Eubacterium] yurii subsp. margaretiae ATCC 43715]